MTQINNRISVVVVVKNEQGRVKECLESVIGWADEIVVVDDLSTDETPRIARELGARVLSRKMDIEGRHRNWAYSQAENEWVFSLDADERPTPELKAEIKQVIADTGHTYFSIPFKTFIGDYWIRWGGWYPGPKVKLFRKSKFRYEEVEVHPRIIVQGTCGHLKGDVLHYSYRDWGDYLKKTDTQTTLEAAKWYKLSLADPKKAAYKMNTLHALWRTLDRFWRTFAAKRGYRDGFTGFMVAYLSSLYQIISYAKYRDMKKREEGKPGL